MSALTTKLTTLARSFATDVVALACRSTIHDINQTLDGPHERPAGKPARAGLAAPAAPQARGGFLSSVPFPRPRATGRFTYTKDYIEPLIALVHEAPWAPRARELRAILGVKKDPFLRIVNAAIATGRVVRTGYKANVTYLPAKDGKPLKIAEARVAAGARPRATKPYHKETPTEPASQVEATEPAPSFWSSALAGTEEGA